MHVTIHLSRTLPSGSDEQPSNAGILELAARSVLVSLAFGKWCSPMSLCDIKRTIASALPKITLLVLLGTPKVGWESKATRLCSGDQTFLPDGR